MGVVYEHDLVNALARHGLRGTVEVMVSTVVAIRLQTHYAGQSAVQADAVEQVRSRSPELRIRWRHDPHLPHGTVAWTSSNGRRIVPVASLLLAP